MQTADRTRPADRLPPLVLQEELDRTRVDLDDAARDMRLRAVTVVAMAVALGAGAIAALIAAGEVFRTMIGG